LREAPLRDLLKRLPDFADVAKEREALSFAASYPDPHRALDFLAAWPDLRRAAAVVENRLAAIDGDCYWVLGPAAERLEPKEPLAATLLYRKMIDFTLGRARSSRYGHAAWHLRSCAPNRSAIGAGIYPMPTTTLICANSTAARSASGAGSTTIADRK
jgi:hypothetical protein